MSGSSPSGVLDRLNELVDERVALDPAWIDGGPTALDDLGLFSSRHHHRLHEPDWTVTGIGAPIRIHRPDGREVT